MSSDLARRQLLKTAGCGVLHAVPSQAQTIVPNSAGTESQTKRPLPTPPIATCIYDPSRFPLAPSPRAAPAEAAVPQYQLFQRRIGTTRVVIVTPRNYARDNRATVDAIAQLGKRMLEELRFSLPPRQTASFGGSMTRVFGESVKPE